MRGEEGAATVEWTALVLVVALALGGLAAAVPAVDGRSLGGAIAHRFVCAVERSCGDDERELIAAYGPGDAELVRRHAPSIAFEPGERQLPVDFRACREPACATAPDDRDLDAHRTTDGGRPATAFTRVTRAGGETFVQYWLYYPDSNTAVLGSDEAWRYAGPAVRLAGRLITGSWDYPGYHRDDWESYQVRIARSGAARVRASSHHGYRWCKATRCENRWGEETGWTRVSRGSHAGHVPLGAGDRPAYPGVHVRERTTTAAGLRLVPTETLAHERYRRLDPDVSPPWEKRVYDEPRSDSTG